MRGLTDNPECVYMVFNVNKFQKVKVKGAFDDDF